MKLLRGIEKHLGHQIEKQIIEGFEVDPRITAEPIRKSNKPIKRNRENFKKNKNKTHPSKRWSKRKPKKK